MIVVYWVSICSLAYDQKRLRLIAYRVVVGWCQAHSDVLAGTVIGAPHMLASYTHLFPDENGVSHFEVLEVELIPGFMVPPAEPLHFAEFVHGGRCRWVGGTPEWKGDAPHPVPQRMIIIPIRGAFEVTAGDGTIREFKPGDVLIAEDTWGSGHATRMVGDVDCITLFIELADTARVSE